MNKTGVKRKNEAKRMAQVKKSSWGVLARGDCSNRQPTRALSKK